MRLLLDTQVFIWHITGDPDLPKAFIDPIEDRTNEVFVSVASIWEAVIKFRLGKLVMPEAPSQFLPVQREAHGFESLVVDEAVMPHLERLPGHHRDPFDRLLVAQALQHDLMLVTTDRQVTAYPARCLTNA